MSPQGKEMEKFARFMKGCLVFLSMEEAEQQGITHDWFRGPGKVLKKRKIDLQLDIKYSENQKSAGGASPSLTGGILLGYA